MMQTRTFFESDLDTGVELALAGGSVCVYTSRCPGKETPNEDAAAVIAIDDKTAVLVLADGLGGTTVGQKAAQIAVESVQKSVEAAGGDAMVLRSAILDGFEKANEAIMALGVGAATTLAVVEIQGDEIRPYHVGDSEILVVGGQGKIKLQTVSHSPVGYAVEAGILDEEEAMQHEERQFVSNTVGMADMRIEIGSPVKMAQRDTMLLSSDGLTDNLHSDEIIETIRKGSLVDGVEKLASDARERMNMDVEGQPSKPDDLTIVVFRPVESAEATTKSQLGKSEWLSSDLVSEISERLDAGKRVRRTLPDGGRLHIDRRLPFLCIYREPVKAKDEGTDQLIEGEASFLVSTAARRAQKSLAELVRNLAESMAERFGAFLIVEIWSAPDEDVADAADTDDLKPTELKPDFVISARAQDIPARTVESLRANLSRVSIMRQKASVEIDWQVHAHPTGLAYLLKSSDARELNVSTIGICVRPIYRNHETGEVFPAVLHSLKRGLGRALKQSFFTFAKTRTTARPDHYYSLGRRAMVKAVWDVDARLSEISDSFDFLLQVTPVNAEAAWREFRRSKFEKVPRFYYRPFAAEPAVLKRLLYEVRIENIEDPTLAELFRQRQDELDRKITMLIDISTPKFLLGSQQVYGRPNAELLTLAHQLLDKLSSRSRDESSRGQLSADEFARKAQDEIDFYCAQLPSFKAKAIVRDDMFSGLLCSGGNLLIGHRTMIPERRVEALLQHEIGTHLLTYYNGLIEPFQQLHSGFAGYDALQEGLAVLTEFLVGGLSIPRMRMLAARVAAANMLVEGATFIETFRKLDVDYDFSQRLAYTITMRTFRGGGLTKDAVYLQGLIEILDYLKQDGRLDPLFVGKIAAEHIPLIQELQHRKVIKPPVLRPRYLEMPGVADRLEQTKNGITVIDLIKKG